MIVTLYQEYLLVIKRLTEIYKLHVDVGHKDSHTFYKDKVPIFKLLFGTSRETGETNIVVSFHIGLKIHNAVAWFVSIYHEHPLIQVAESFIEDSQGELYIGEDAEFIQKLIQEREIIIHWLDNRSPEEMIKLAKTPVIGRKRDYRKSYHSRLDVEEATIEFEHLKKPKDDGDVH
jgi:hypothetical protein